MVWPQPKSTLPSVNILSGNRWWRSQQLVDLTQKVEQMLSKDSKAAVAALVSRVADKPKKTRTVKVSTLQTEQPEKKSQREKKNQFNTSKHVSKTY